MTHWPNVDPNFMYTLSILGLARFIQLKSLSTGSAQSERMCLLPR